MKQNTKINRNQIKCNKRKSQHTLREGARAFEYADVRALLLEQNTKDGGVQATHLPTRLKSNQIVNKTTSANWTGK